MILFLFLPHLLLSHLYLSTISPCSEEQIFQSKKTAQLCFQEMLSKLGTETSCDKLDFHQSDCGKGLEKCFQDEFVLKMEDFYMEKAINIKKWIFLAQKLLEDDHAKSVFYFFSPFLVRFCGVTAELEWEDIFYEECLHVRSILQRWPAGSMMFLQCPSIDDYLHSGRKGVTGPVLSCDEQSNQEYQFCVQKYWNILPAKKNSSWKDACRSLRQVTTTQELARAWSPSIAVCQR